MLFLLSLRIESFKSESDYINPLMNVQQNEISKTSLTHSLHGTNYVTKPILK